MASGLIPGTPVGQLFSRSSQPTTPTLQDIQENNLGGVSSGHAIPQLHPENSHLLRTKIILKEHVFWYGISLLEWQQTS